ncbi:dTDP-4-dehydrorhamnose 3,5-epimerase [Niabella soli]|uniref:dTDP-4-dehydrorhamnose 3,5-epimerase n=1 Tax=Niabella soli DSM 19437 TaxID=929713 RepID=W0EU04_9BACT|nr:dTDP-4-dehydrorhamnose 3,5-epimerase [Niabella soli]AHF14242.1 dTDP-4-dehydrorhamnose 3,5-epimerase [Niabella soli DSM 19437]
MKVTETRLRGCFIIEPQLFKDERGYFFESFNEARFNERMGISTHFVQDNQSFSTRGVIRGLHAQTGDFAQAKLVRVLQGEVLDVAVDARPGSPTFGQHVAVTLSAANQLQFFIPRGFLHGFSVLSNTAVFFYKCDNYYNKASETGVVYNDPGLNINWQVDADKAGISPKDAELPFFNDVFK